MIPKDPMQELIEWANNTKLLLKVPRAYMEAIDDVIVKATELLASPKQDAGLNQLLKDGTKLMEETIELLKSDPAYQEQLWKDKLSAALNELYEQCKVWMCGLKESGLSAGKVVNAAIHFLTLNIGGEKHLQRYSANGSVIR